MYNLVFLYRLSILINVFYKKKIQKKNIKNLFSKYIVVNTTDIIYKWGNVFS